jgi:hypothetical protein
MRRDDDRLVPSTWRMTMPTAHRRFTVGGGAIEGFLVSHAVVARVGDAVDEAPRSGQADGVHAGLARRIEGEHRPPGDADALPLLLDAHAQTPDGVLSFPCRQPGNVVELPRNQSTHEPEGGFAESARRITTRSSSGPCPSSPMGRTELDGISYPRSTRSSQSRSVQRFR